MQKGRVTLRVAGGIPYELTRKKVKCFNLHVRRDGSVAVSYTHLRAHKTLVDLVFRLMV